MDANQVTPEFLSMLASLSTPTAALLAAAYLARRVDSLTAKILEVMTQTVERNTAALAEMKTTVAACGSRDPRKTKIPGER